MAMNLRDQYYSEFGYKSYGVSRQKFDDFYAICEEGFRFDQEWGDFDYFCHMINKFFEERRNNTEDSVWRLYQMVQLDEADFWDAATRFKREFEPAMKDYALVQDGESNSKAKTLVRKRLYQQAIEHCEEKKALIALASARDAEALRLFVSIWNRRKFKPKPEELNLIWQPETTLQMEFPSID